MLRLITQEASAGYPTENTTETVSGRARAHASVTGQVVERYEGQESDGRGAWSSGAERVDSKNSEHVLQFR